VCRHHCRKLSLFCCCCCWCCCCWWWCCCEVKTLTTQGGSASRHARQTIRARQSCVLADVICWVPVQKAHQGLMLDNH
jgi:hypothetical protein